MPTLNRSSRRAFIKDVARTAGAAAFVGSAMSGKSFALPAQGLGGSEWAKHIGLELWTVRDFLTDPKMREATLAKVAALGFSEIEPDHGPSGGYLGLSPKEFRGLLDRLGLSMPSTHLPQQAGPDLEKNLAGFQVMGLKYVVIIPEGGDIYHMPGQIDPAGSGVVPSSEQIKRECDLLNKYGAIAKKFGMKVIVHNHTTEFAPLPDDKEKTPYDLFIANTDPSGVVLQLDIGWAAIAARDIVDLFKKAPGRYEIWHVKDASNIKLMPREMSTYDRRKVAQLVPVGLGDVDYKTIFANAGLAGMKHFCVEQDNAAAWGDSLAAAKTSYSYLSRLLST
jgi:sugar phosphate isomerase/epimerase